MDAASTAWGLGTVERRSTTDQVLHELRTAILAQTFGTGRSAIREALRQLVQEGLVVSELNRGAWVRPLSTADVIDVYRARTAIEVAAVQAAVEHNGGYDLTPLRAAQDRIRAASGSDGTEAPSRDLIAADLDFHRELVALAGSPRLSRAHEPLAAESQMLLNWHPVYSVSDYVSDHQQLLDVLECRDALAGEAVRAHLTLTVDLIMQEAERYASRLASADRLVTNDDIVDNEGSSG
jgi:DNA-binding GntR family transcriptional regulator